MENIDIAKERAVMFLARKHGVPQHKLKFRGKWDVSTTGDRLLLFNITQQGHRKFRSTVAYNRDSDY